MDHYGRLYVFSLSFFVRGVLAGSRRDSTRLFAAKGLRGKCLPCRNWGNKAVVPLFSSSADGNPLLGEVEVLRLAEYSPRISF